MLEAPWVGRTPEEYHEATTGEKEYTVYFSMIGSISIFASNKEEAEEKVKELSHFELTDYVEEVEVDDID